MGGGTFQGSLDYSLNLSWKINAAGVILTIERLIIVKPGILEAS